MYKKEIISSHIIRIRDFFNDGIYIIKGEDKTVLIDTFVGVKGLRNYLENDLNIKIDFVLLTHGHVDHVGGMGEFEDIPAYLNFADLDLAKRQVRLEHRKEYISYAESYTRKQIEHYELAEPYRFSNINKLEDQKIFDLGGVHIKTIFTPGHTKGLCMFLIEEDRTVVFGDGCGNCVLLLNNDASSVESYRSSLTKLKEYENDYDYILRFHGSCESEKGLLDNVIECCDDILNKKDDHQYEPHPFFACEDAYYAKALAKDGRGRADGKNGNICYRMSKIYD